MTILRNSRIVISLQNRPSFHNNCYVIKQNLPKDELYYAGEQGKMSQHLLYILNNEASLWTTVFYKKMLRNGQVVITSQERTKNRCQKFILYTNKKIQIINAKYISAELRP